LLPGREPGRDQAPQTRAATSTTRRSFAAWATRHYFNFRKISIYGGSNEIQRNIVAKAVLGL